MIFAGEPDCCRRLMRSCARRSGRLLAKMDAAKTPAFRARVGLMQYAERLHAYVMAEWSTGNWNNWGEMQGAVTSAHRAAGL